MEVSPIFCGPAAQRARREPVRFAVASTADPDAELATSRQRYLDAIHIPAGILVLEDGEPRLSAHNRAFTRLVTRQAEQGSLAPLVRAVRMFLGSDRERHATAWQQPGIGGRHFQVHLSKLPPYGDHPHRAMLSLVDRTAEVETERSLRAEMLHDSLTGLPNRAAFTEAVEAAIETGGRDGAGFATLALNLGRFSRINEGVGALAGDELIITVARRLVSALRDGDLLARMAGDEFGVLVQLSDGADDAIAVAERLRAALAAPVRLSDLEIRVDCAIGCAVWSDLAPTVGDLLRNAQVALKRAKLSGRVEVYRPGEVAHARRRFSIETELRRAIEHGDLSLAFQPLVGLETDTLHGFEALARWTHPDHGAIAPSEFIPVAEECGLIVPLGRWALDCAARTLTGWDAALGRTAPVRVAVNVSPVQLARDSVHAAVKDTLAAHRLAGERLTLELTESSIVADPDHASSVLRGLHGLGCKVAMDDFGTGYSSLASLQRLPIDILKIDRSFVADMHADRDSVAIIRAILNLAQTLGMATTAEGIENGEAARMLAAMGCTHGQGYHYARPLPTAAAFDYLRARIA